MPENTHLIPFERLLPIKYSLQRQLCATDGDVWSDISAIGLFDVCWRAVEISGWLGPGPDAGLAQPLSQFEEKF